MMRGGSSAVPVGEETGHKKVGEVGVVGAAGVGVAGVVVVGVA